MCVDLWVKEGGNTSQSDDAVCVSVLSITPLCLSLSVVDAVVVVVVVLIVSVVLCYLINELEHPLHNTNVLWLSFIAAT